MKVKRSDRSLPSRGIYLREPLDAAHPTSHIVDVTPRLKEVQTHSNPASSISFCRQAGSRDGPCTGSSFGLDMSSGSFHEAGILSMCSFDSIRLPVEWA